MQKNLNKYLLSICLLAPGISICADEASTDETTEEASSTSEATAQSAESTVDASSKAPDGSEALSGMASTCELNGNLIRKIWITYEGDQGERCDVRYLKETEDPGNEQSLWNAREKPEFCQERAKELISKLEGWGWSCTASK